VEYLLTTCNADVLAVDDEGKSCLHLAVSDAVGDAVEVVRYLLENYPDADFVAKTDNEGNTPLHCLDNDIIDVTVPLEIFRLLLECGAQVNAINNDGQSPLHKMAKYGPVTVVQDFIQHGADLLAKGNAGDAPFDVAIANYGQNEVEDYLLTVAYRNQVFEQKGNLSIHAILDVAEYRYLAQEEESEEKQEDEEESAQQQQTLQVCLPVGKLTVDQLRALLRSFDGDPMHQEDDTGALPFHVACRTPAPVEILDLLLQEFPGALHIADHNNPLPIHCACQADSVSLSVLQFLLERAPASVRAHDNTGSLPLHWLCGSKTFLEETVMLLLKAYDGSVSVRRNNGDLPLMVAYKTRASLGVCLVLLRTYPDALEDL